MCGIREELQQEREPRSLATLSPSWLCPDEQGMGPRKRVKTEESLPMEDVKNFSNNRMSEQIKGTTALLLFKRL